MNIINSPIQTISLRNKVFFIKRDDLLDKEFSGNKARKFYYYLKHDFKDIKKIVSHGSNQSNAMYSMSVLAKLKGWEFDYYVDHIPSFLKSNPSGNYKYALQNGMNIIEGKEPDIMSLISDSSIVYVSEGGADKEAKYGIKILADEILSWAKEKNIKDLKVFLPSGTGTTALYLQKYLPFDVYTCACVGDSEYLKKQFFELEPKEFHPKVLETPRKFHFGKLYRQNYEIWQELTKSTGIEFDLLYDPIGWQTLLGSPLVDGDVPLLYIHQGGLIGNETMIERYKRKY